MKRNCTHYILEKDYVCEKCGRKVIDSEGLA